MSHVKCVTSGVWLLHLRSKRFVDAMVMCHMVMCHTLGMVLIPIPHCRLECFANEAGANYMIN